MNIEDAMDVLDVNRNELSNKDIIKRKWKKQVFANHPDKGGDEEKIKLINNAYTTLTNYTPLTKDELLSFVLDDFLDNLIESILDED